MTPPPARLPEITDVQRLTVQPGDILIIKIDRDPSMQEAHILRERIRAAIGETPILIIPPGFEITAANLAAEIVRALKTRARTGYHTVTDMLNSR
jgi:hypothetical protein